MIGVHRRRVQIHQKRDRHEPQRREQRQRACIDGGLRIHQKRDRHEPQRREQRQRACIDGGFRSTKNVTATNPSAAKIQSGNQSA